MANREGDRQAGYRYNGAGYWECEGCGMEAATGHKPGCANDGRPAQSEPLTERGIMRVREFLEAVIDWAGPGLTADSKQDALATLDRIASLRPPCGCKYPDACVCAHERREPMDFGPAPSEALEGLIEKHPLDALLAIADRLLAEFYPEDVFPDAPDEPATGDSGPQLIRAVRRARADLARDALPEGTRGDD